MRRHTFHTLGVVLAIFLASSSYAQESTNQTPARGDAEAAKRVTAVRVPNGTITIDGRLSEAEWQLAGPATNFVQQQPQENVPATEDSEVRFLYDDDNLELTIPAAGSSGGACDLDRAPRLQYRRARIQRKQLAAGGAGRQLSVRRVL